MTEHLQIGEKIIVALRDKQPADELARLWYANADKMADAFSAINPYYNRDELRQMFYNHLDLTAQELVKRLARNFKEDIDNFGKVERETMMMADYFTQGIFKEFPHEFD